MSSQAVNRHAQSASETPQNSDAVDARFRTLLGSEAWSRLPEPVRRRFAKRISSDGVVLYRGIVTVMNLSWCGRLLAHAARLVGSPLPTAHGALGPVVVAVTEDAASGGQRWLRLYERHGRKPQLIHSTKRFRGPTGLDEYVGAGLSMQLLLSVEDGALVFRSHRYLIEYGRVAMRVPSFLSPGSMTIVHRQEEDGTFSFRLTLKHPLFGQMLEQIAIFWDV